MTTTYEHHVKEYPYLLTSPCADKFGCPSIEVDKNHCRKGCRKLAAYLHLLDTYGQVSIGGLSYGHVFQSAIDTTADIDDFASSHNNMGHKLPSLS